MTTIFERVNAALSSLSPAVPYAMDTYLSESGGTLPNQFIVYQLIDGVPTAHYDNEETHRSYRVQVSIASKTGLVSLPNVNAAMLAQGFKKGPERTLPKDQETGHYVLAKDFFFLEEES